MTYNILMYGVMTSDEKQDFYKNSVIDKYTIINHHLDEELTKIISKVSWNHGIIILR